MKTVALILVYDESQVEVERAVRSAIDRFDRVIVGNAGLNHYPFPDFVERIRCSNVSVIRNRKELVETVSEESLCVFLDGDDWFLPTIVAMVHFAERICADSVIGDVYQVVRGTERPFDSDALFWSVRGKYWPGWLPDWGTGKGRVTAGHLFSNVVGQYGSMAFRRSLWDKIGELDDWGGGDDMIIMPLLAAVGEVVTYPVPVMVYQTPGENSVSWDWPEDEDVELFVQKRHKELTGQPMVLFDRDWKSV